MSGANTVVKWQNTGARWRVRELESIDCVTVFVPGW